MARQIKASDVFEGDIFENVRQSAIKTIETLDKMNNELRVTAQTMKKELGSLKIDSLSSIKQLIQLTEKANKLNKESIAINKARNEAVSAKTKAEIEALAIEKQRQQTAQESIKTQREQLKLTRDQERAEKQRTKEQEKALKVARDEANAYKQLERNTRELKNESKRLGAEMLLLEQSGRKNTKEFYALKNQYDQVTKSAQRGDAQLKKLDKTVHDNFRNVGNYASAVSKLQGFLSQLGLAFGVGAVVQKSISVLTSFDEGVANMGKTLNITTGEAEKLARELLNIDTRTSVENLQQIATIGGQLGISAQDIVAFTESVDKLNVALGDEFTGGAEEITSVVAGLRNVFIDLKSKNVSDDLLKIGNALNVLGAEGSATSPIMSDFASRIGGVGIPLGLSTDQVLGLSSTLQELNVNAERGGTAIGRVLKQMAQDTEGFAKFAGVPVEEFTKMVNTDLFGAFQKVVQATKNYKGNAVGLATALDALKIDGAGASEVFLKLGTNMDLLNLRTSQANKSLQETTSITDEFNKKNNTLQAKIDQLKNAFDKYILGIDQSGNVTGKFGKFLDFVTNNLGKIFTILGKVITYYGLYRAMLVAVATKQYLFNGGLLESVKNLGEVFKSTKQATDGTQQLATGMQNAGRSMTAIPWMAIIGLAYELGKALYESATGVTYLQDKLKKIDKYNSASEKSASQRSEKRQQALTKELNALERKKNLELASAKTTEQKSAVEKAYLKQKEALIKTTDNQIRTDIKAVAERKKGFKADMDILEDAYRLYESRQISIFEYAQKGRDIAKKYGFEYVTNTDVIQNLSGAVSGANTKLKIYNAELEQNGESLKDATNQTKINSYETADFTTEKDKATKKLKEFKTELESVNEYLTIQNELLADINRLQTEKIIQAKQDEIDQLLANDIKYVTETGIVQVDALEKLIDEKYQLEKQAILDQQAEQLKLIEQGYTEQSRKEREELKKKRDELLAQEGLTADKKKEIQDNYDKEIAQIELNDLQRNADFELEKQKLGLETNKQLIDLEKKKGEEINNVNDQLYDAQVEYYDGVADKSKETIDKEIENEKQLAETRRQLFQLATDYFIKQSQRRIEQIDKEIAKAEEQSDYLKQLAINGNINAKESLAEQQRIINEANLRKEKEQRRQQRLQLLNTAFQTYNNKLESGSENPLAETIRDIGLLRAFVETIPAFEKGTEDTGTNGRGVDGKGGFHAILHPNERVIPKSMNEKIGSMSNEQLTKIAQEYQNGRIIKSNDQIGSALDTALLINKLDELTETIKLKPETNIELGEITQSMMEVVKSTKKGNTMTYNRYKIRK